MKHSLMSIRIPFSNYIGNVEELTVFVSCAYSSYRSLINISRVRSRFRENVGV